MEQTAVGLVAAKDGWFTVSVRDAAWMTGDAFGDACTVRCPRQESNLEPSD